MAGTGGERVIAGSLTRKQAEEEVTRFAAILVREGLASEYGVARRSQQLGLYRVVVARHDDQEMPVPELGTINPEENQS